MADEEKRTPAEEVRARLDEIEASAKTKAEKLEERVRVVEDENARLEKEMLARAQPIGNEKAGTKPVSFLKLARGMATGDWSGAEYEREVVRPSERTAQATTTDTLGGYIVPPEYLPQEFVEQIYTETNFIAAGARTINIDGSSPVIIPTQEGSGTTYWVGENSSITESNLTFGQKTAIPHQLAALTKASNRSIRDTNPGIEMLIREDLARILAVELDRACIYGSGASNEILGLTLTSGIGTTSAGAAIDLDKAWDMIDQIEINYHSTDGLAWLFKYEQWHDLRKAADATGQPKYYTGAGAPISKEAYGFPVYLDGNLTDGDAIAGVFREALIMQWGGLEFMASQHADTAFAANQTWIRAIMDVDLVVRQPKAFCFDTSFT